MMQPEEEEDNSIDLDLWEMIDVSRLDQLDADGINIQCVNSSEFVVGRQTNFNGPVTIINCDKGLLPQEVKSRENPDGEKSEKIVIRNKILSESASAKIQEMAVKNSGGKDRTDTGNRKKQAFWSKRSFLQIPNILWIGFCAVLIGAAITATLVFAQPEVGMDIAETIGTKKKDPAEGQISRCRAGTGGREENDICIYADYKWGGRKNQEKVLLSTPVPYVVISETDGEICFDYESCLGVVERFQVEGDEPAGNVTSCNFLVGSDGNLYEDRGWNLTNSLGGPAAGKSIEICLMGNSIDYPTYPQVEAARNFIRYGSRKNYLIPNYVLLASNATSDKNLSTNVYRIIKKWPHFRQKPFEMDEDFPEGGFRVYSKEDWGGKAPKSTIEMKLPVPYVVISHSVTSLCYEFESCAPLIKGIQTYHQSLDYADIAYNFLVDSSGNIYEGRGWSRRNVAGGFINGRNVDVNLIGDFSRSLKPTTRQMNGVKYLIRTGLETGKIAKNYSLLSANATFSTLSPGQNVYDVIKNWPHFDPEPEEHVKEYDQQ